MTLGSFGAAFTRATVSASTTIRIFRGSIARLACSLSTLRRRGRPRLRKTRFRLVVSLCRTVCCFSARHRKEGFSDYFVRLLHRVLPPQALPGAPLVNGNDTVDVIDAVSDDATGPSTTRSQGARRWSPASHLDVMRVDELIEVELYARGIELLERIVAMLTKLIDA